MSQGEEQTHTSRRDTGGGKAVPAVIDDEIRPDRADILAAACTARMIALFILLAFAALVCIRLGAWQLDRAALRGAEKAEAAHAEKIASDPRPLAEVMRVGEEMTEREHSTPVCVRGEFVEEQIAVVGRGVGSQSAILAAAGLRISEGPDAGAIIPVIRGWMPDSADETSDGNDGAGSAVGRINLPKMTSAQLQPHTVCGYLVGPERAQAAPSNGVTKQISPAALISVWGRPMFGGYLAQSYAMGGDEARPASGLDQLPPPRLPGEHGVNIQNLAYAIEWVIFAGFAIGLWFKMVRDEARNRREDAILATLAAAEEGRADE